MTPYSGYHSVDLEKELTDLARRELSDYVFMGGALSDLEERTGIDRQTLACLLAGERQNHYMRTVFTVLEACGVHIEVQASIKKVSGGAKVKPYSYSIDMTNVVSMPDGRKVK